MLTLKFKLKRKYSGTTLRKLKRAEVFPVPKYKSYVSRPKNKPVGERKREPTIYQLEDQHMNQANYHDKYRTNMVNPGEWYAFRILQQAKNPTQKERVYKLYPKHSPEYKRKLEHEKKVRIWQEKLKQNYNEPF